MRTSVRRAGGFTVIELLVAVAIIAILISLLLPALGEIREQSIEQRGRVNLRSTHAIFSLYTMDNKEFWPYATDPDLERTPIRYHGTQEIESEYFRMTAFWRYALADAYFNGDIKAPSNYWPVSYDHRQPAQFLYSGTFLASSDYWIEGRREGPRQWRATTVAQVQYTSDKGLLAFKDFWIGPGHSRNGDNDYVIAFVDGHVQRYNRHELGDFHPGGDGPEDWSGGSQVASPFEHTLAGVRGRDRAPEREGLTKTAVVYRQAAYGGG